MRGIVLTSTYFTLQLHSTVTTVASWLSQMWARCRATSHNKTIPSPDWKQLHATWRLLRRASVSRWILSSAWANRRPISASISDIRSRHRSRSCSAERSASASRLSRLRTASRVADACLSTDPFTAFNLRNIRKKITDRVFHGGPRFVNFNSFRFVLPELEYGLSLDVPPVVGTTEANAEPSTASVPDINARKEACIRRDIPRDENFRIYQCVAIPWTWIRLVYSSFAGTEYKCNGCRS